MRFVWMDERMTQASRRMQSETAASVRGRLDREYDMKIQPLSFAISDPAKAPEEEESLLDAKNCKVVKNRPTEISAPLS